MTTHLPERKDIRDLLMDLLGREVTINASAAYAPGPSEPATLAVYVDDYAKPSALVVADLAFSVYCGASIGLVPVAGAETAIEAGDMNDVLRENFYEVLNIASSLFNAPEHDHLKLKEVKHAKAGGMDPLDRVQAFTLGRRDDLSIDIEGYGHGLLSVILMN